MAMPIRNGMKAYILVFMDKSQMVTLDSNIAMEHKARRMKVIETRLLADS